MKEAEEDTIPCVVSNPRLNVSLYERPSRTLITGIIYEPGRGFTGRLNDTSYLCVAADRDTEVESQVYYVFSIIGEEVNTCLLSFSPFLHLSAVSFETCFHHFLHLSAVSFSTSVVSLSPPAYCLCFLHLSVVSLSPPVCCLYFSPPICCLPFSSCLLYASLSPPVFLSLSPPVCCQSFPPPVCCFFLYLSAIRLFSPPVYCLCFIHLCPYYLSFSMSFVFLFLSLSLPVCCLSLSPPVSFLYLSDSVTFSTCLSLSFQGDGGGYDGVKHSVEAGGGSDCKLHRQRY